MKFETEIPNLSNAAETMSPKESRNEKSNMATRQPFRKWGNWKSIGSVTRVRGDPPLLQSAMDILWRLRFSRLRQAPSRKAWYSRGPVKSKIIASYVHENFYLWYFILPQIMVSPCSINITARLACTNNHTCSTDSLARLIIAFKSTK